MSTVIPSTGQLTIILSAERGYRSDRANAKFHAMLLRILGERLEAGELLAVQECQGSYKGTLERSVAITGPAAHTLTIGPETGKAFIQESVLVVDKLGYGCLHYMTGEHESIGRYQGLTSTEGVDAWTRVLATGETFTFA